MKERFRDIDIGNSGQVSNVRRVSPMRKSTSHRLPGENGAATPGIDHPSKEEGVSSPSRGHTPVEGDVAAMLMVGAENGLVTCTRSGRIVGRPVTLADYVRL